jgi:hypothetical protein
MRVCLQHARHHEVMQLLHTTLRHGTHAQNARNLHMLWAEGTCARLGLAGAANISLTTALQALVNASNAPSVATLLNGRLQDLTGSAASSSGTGSGSGVAKVASLQINCTDTVLARARDSAAMRRALYCGYASAHCMRNATTNRCMHVPDFARPKR